LLVPAVSAAAFASGEERLPADDAPASDASVGHVTLLNYRSTSLLLTPRGFVPMGSWRDPEWSSRSAVESGLTEEQASGVRAFIFGRNEVEVEIKGWGRLTVDEVSPASVPLRLSAHILCQALHPFYIFSLCSIALWSYDEYQWYALVIGIISLVGIGASVITTRRALVRLQAQSRYECTVRVLRSAGSEPAEPRWVETSSVELVPGDVIDLSASGASKLDLLPCDCVLLEGEMIAGEAMLTGESVPVVKTACPSAAFSDVLAAAEPLAKLDKHVAWGGTKLIRSRPGPSGTTRALVVQTGFNTAKGSVVRLVLFPKPLQHHFYGESRRLHPARCGIANTPSCAGDAFRFIGILCVVAVLGFVGSLVRFIQLGVDRTEIALRALDLFTITIPPALPAA
jgi:cation-transporting ATPase 13A3/4/5